MNYLFMIIVSIYALFIGYKYIKPQVKGYIFITLLSLIGISSLLFLFIELMTFKPRPNGAVSGNGNPVLLLVFVLVPVFLALIYLWVKGVYKGFAHQSQSYMKKHLLYGFSLCVIGVFLQIVFIIKKLNTLENHPYNPFEVGYQGSIINQYTNNLFFNGSIYGIILTGALVGTLLTLQHKKNKIKKIQTI
jgi:hypothetical protein